MPNPSYPLLSTPLQKDPAGRTNQKGGPLPTPQKDQTGRANNERALHATLATPPLHISHPLKVEWERVTRGRYYH